MTQFQACLHDNELSREFHYRISFFGVVQENQTESEIYIDDETKEGTQNLTQGTRTSPKVEVLKRALPIF